MSQVGVETQKKFWSLRSQHCFVPPKRVSKRWRMASGIDIYSQLLISAIRISDITIWNY